MTYDEIVEVLAVELFVVVANNYRTDWSALPEAARVYYRDKAKELIRVLTEKDVWVTDRSRLQRGQPG